jgi:Predicted membrane protein
LTPDHPVGPFGVLNLRVLWTLVVMVMLISSMGYVALRAFGPRLGLPLTGLASGFVSSVATIGSMGARASQQVTVLKSAVAGAILSTVSTIVQLAIVVAITDRSTLVALRIPLIFSGVMAVIYAALFISRGLTEKRAAVVAEGRAFNWRAAVGFAVTIFIILSASVVLREWLGKTGLFVSAGVAGFADAHAVAISAASLVAASRLTPAEAVSVILIALTANTISKIVVAATAGRQFALRIIPGLILVLVAAWAGRMLGM